MGFKDNTKVQPWICILRGAKETDIAKLYDSEQYGKGNGIFCNLKQADVTSILAPFIDGVIKSALMGNGVKIVDEEAVRQKDTDITDARGLALTITFETGEKAKAYIPMAKIATIPALALAVAKLEWKSADGTILKAVTVDYKTTVQVV